MVAALADDLSEAQAERQLDARGLLVTPGLVDVHTHLYWGVSHYGIEPDPHCLARGVTTALDAGTAGAQTFPAFRRFIIEQAGTRILALLNVSAMGMIHAGVGELEDLRYADTDLTVRVAREHPGLVVGLKVRLGEPNVADNGLAALAKAREAADRLGGVPIMVHLSQTVVPLTEILARLERGDLVTHCYHGYEHGILDGRGGVVGAARDAAERGIIFDVGHGVGSFKWEVAEQAVSQGFLPGTISSDIHAYSAPGPAVDLVTTLSKFLHLRLSLDQVLERATGAAARAMGLAERLGTLRIGAEGDLTLLEVEDDDFPLTDCHGQTRVGHRRLAPRHVVKGGVERVLAPA
jgi:dihydroorotase